MGEMRNKMYVQEILLSYRHSSHTAPRAEPAVRFRFTRGLYPSIQASSYAVTFTRD